MQELTIDPNRRSDMQVGASLTEQTNGGSGRDLCFDFILHLNYINGLLKIGGERLHHFNRRFLLLYVVKGCVYRDHGQL